MRVAAILALALAASPAAAAEPPQATAAAAGGSVGDQIAEFLRTSPAAPIEEGVAGVTPRDDGADDRRVHGEVAVAVGTGGYRSVYMRSEMPLGRTGRLSLAFGDERSRRGGVRGLDAGPPHGAFGVDRQRCDLEGLTPPRALDVMGGPHGRCVRPPSW